MRRESIPYEAEGAWRELQRRLAGEEGTELTHAYGLEIDIAGGDLTAGEQARGPAREGAPRRTCQRC